MLRAFRAAAGLETQPGDSTAESVERLHASELAPAIAAALAVLPVAQSDVLLLHTYAELTPDEIAEALGISTGSVRKRLHRARRFMAERLGLNGNEGDETLRTADYSRRTDQAMTIDELLRRTANAVERDAEAEHRAIGRAQRALSAAIAAEPHRIGPEPMARDAGAHGRRAAQPGSG